MPLVTLLYLSPLTEQISTSGPSCEYVLGISAFSILILGDVTKIVTSDTVNFYLKTVPLIGTYYVYTNHTLHLESRVTSPKISPGNNCTHTIN